jgi:lipoprotein-anchoring transpeptidase ErfK/SrfK
VPGSWYGYPSMLPVIAAKGRWLEVRLAQRPNESTAWIPRSAVTTTTVPYAVLVNLSTERLTVYQSGQPILSFPAGIGSPASPTPPGNFFLTMTAPAPDPGYGPFVLVTSAHSDAITDWEDSGDAIIAIHGPIDALDDALIGATGAAISSGCVRLHDADLAQLSMLPAGTPVDIISG